MNASSYVGQIYTVDTMNSTNYTAMCDYAYGVQAGSKGVWTNLAAVGGGMSSGFTSNPGCVNTINGVVPGTFFPGNTANPQMGLKMSAPLPPAQTVTAQAYSPYSTKPSALNCGYWNAGTAATGYYPGWYGALAGASSCSAALQSGNWAGCCNFLDSQVGQSNPAAIAAGTVNCFCDAETAAFMFGALGPGNAPKGQGALGPLFFNSLLGKCNSLGYVQLFWPQTYAPASPYIPGAPNASFACTPQLPPQPLPGSVRPPYLMTPTSSGITIRWRSAAATPTVVSYGLSASNLSLTFSADAAGVTEHVAVLTGLAAGTQYFYAAGAAASTTTASTSYFKTSPAPGAYAASRIFFLGDMGSTTNGVPAAVSLDSGKQAKLFAAWSAFEATSVNADLFLALGDNAYYTGSDQLFQYNFFGIYDNASTPATLMSRTATYPILGNHDTYSCASRHSCDEKPRPL